MEGEGEEKEEMGRKGREKGREAEGKERGRLRHGFWGMDAPDRLIESQKLIMILNF